MVGYDNSHEFCWRCLVWFECAVGDFTQWCDGNDLVCSYKSLMTTHDEQEQKFILSSLNQNQDVRGHPRYESAKLLCPSSDHSKYPEIPRGIGGKFNLNIPSFSEIASL